MKIARIVQMVAMAEPEQKLSEESDIDFKLLSDTTLSAVYSIVFPKQKPASEKQRFTKKSNRYEDVAIDKTNVNGSAALKIQPGQTMVIANHMPFNMRNMNQPRFSQGININALLNAFACQQSPTQACANVCAKSYNTFFESGSNAGGTDLPVKLEIFGVKLLFSLDMWLNLCNLFEWLVLNGIIDISLFDQSDGHGSSQSDGHGGEATADICEIIEVSDTEAIEISDCVEPEIESIAASLSNLSLDISSISLWESLITQDEWDAAMLALSEDRTENP